MNETVLLEISKKQKERISYIDFRLDFLGTIRRADLEQLFEIKAAAATRDLTLYKEHVPNNITYDTKKKIYKRSDTFKSLFNHSAKFSLSALSQGFGSNSISDQNMPYPCERPKTLNSPSIEVISAISRAIYLKKVIQINYASTSSGISTREIIPFALIDTGHRWHVRAYDRKRNHFGDFVLTRISNSKIIESDILAIEGPSNDIQWNRVVEMEISPHPHLKHKQAILLDYGMSPEEPLKINIKAALAGYFLRYWNIDCSETHNLRCKDEEYGHEYQLWLNNPNQTLHKVKNATLAPGFSLAKK